MLTTHDALTKLLELGFRVQFTPCRDNCHVFADVSFVDYRNEKRGEPLLWKRPINKQGDTIPEIQRLLNELVDLLLDFAKESDQTHFDNCYSKYDCYPHAVSGGKPMTETTERMVQAERERDRKETEIRRLEAKLTENDDRCLVLRKALHRVTETHTEHGKTLAHAHAIAHNALGEA
jgi:hypothetical protein